MDIPVSVDPDLAYGPALDPWVGHHMAAWREGEAVGASSGVEPREGRVVLLVAPGVWWVGAEEEHGAAAVEG